MNEDIQFIECPNVSSPVLQASILQFMKVSLKLMQLIMIQFYQISSLC